MNILGVKPTSHFIKYRQIYKHYPKTLIHRFLEERDKKRAYHHIPPEIQSIT